MIKMLGSRNSRYFVVVQSGLCSFYRDSVSLHGDADFEFLWSVALDPQAQVLDIGNHGELFFRTPRGVFRLPYSREAVPHPLAPLCRVAQGEEGARLGKVRLDHRGVEACYERIVPDATLSKKLLRLLRAGEAETQAFAHEVIFYNIASGEERVFFKGLVEPQKNQRFLWEVSPTFTYLVVGQSVKAGMRFQIINIPQEAVYFDFEMKVPEVADLRINDQGTVLLDVPWEDQQRLVLTNIDKEKFVVSPPPGYQVLHLATHHVLLLVNAGPGLMARTFLDQQACLVDLRPLVEMGFQYSFSFPQRQGDFGAGIDVLTWREGSFRVQRTDLNQIAVDAQRWALLARQHREEEQERLARSTAQAAKEEERRRRGQERSQALARDVTPEEP
ncbi:MAG TPA: hypothetical protein VNO81_01870, partial [Candidatus Nitrosotenuis sp.]|nr:hypothetical protein [Candidatus Nitrosotenuis sp.]